MKVEFYKHNIGEAEIAELVDTLKGTFLTSGPKTKNFETEFAKYLGTQGSLAFTSWTTAAFLVLKAWDIGPGDEVIVPPLTFIATATVVLHCGATPVFVDVEPLTGNIDADQIEAKITKKTKAIIPVHLYGQLADMKKIRQLADRYKLKILEDSAHNIEGTRDGYRAGGLSDAAAFSFYATKNITSGEGGSVASNDLEFLEKLRLLRLHGMSKSAADRYTAKYQHWDMECLGYKANMSDIQSSLLLGQLAKIETLWARKEQICQHYESRFKAAGIEFPVVLPGSKSARHLFTIWSKPGARDQVLAKLQDKNIGVAVNFRAIHLLKYFRETLGFGPGSFPISENIGDRTITLPMYPRLSDSEVEYVADHVIQATGMS